MTDTNDQQQIKFNIMFVSLRVHDMYRKVIQAIVHVEHVKP